MLEKNSESSWSRTLMARAYCTILVFFLLVPSLIADADTTFIFKQFDASSLELYGNASMKSNAISLTQPSRLNNIGRAFYRHPVRMKHSDSLNSTFSFSTSFVFSIVPSPDTESAFGLAFLMTPTKSPEGFLSIQYLGLISNISSVGKASNHLFAVELDTSKNTEFQDIDNNHVGVDINDLRSVNSTPAGYWSDNTHFRTVDLKTGQNIQAWIDFDNLQNELQITIAEAGLDRPQKPLLHIKNISLADVLEEEMYVGFSAATGVMYEENYILAWSFTTNGTAPFLNASSLPSMLHRKSKSSNSIMIAVGITTACVVLVLVGLVASVVRWKRNPYRDLIEEWEVEYWPHRFKYKDLHTATKGFRDDELLGSGGFSQVYRGVLPTNGLQVAVKCIPRETGDGVKEFIAEISSLGRLQHRNLVQIKGFCRRKKELFIVYDYMPNGSLEKLIFGKPQKVLEWCQRYRVLRDVAAGLLYLHEEWERCVVHRDIKSSNVLLDSEFTGKLGDFGLARLYEHNENSQTTCVVGTLGYIAPELIHTGKASPATDVFSFGILMLEVASGRRPVDPSLQPGQTVMVDWVRDLHGNGTLMDAADPNLGGQYVEAEMERVLKLGLRCCNPQPEGRPGTRQVVQTLEEEAPIPDYYASFHLETSNSWRSPICNSYSTPGAFSTSLEVEGR